ncbi:lipopolysaccharide biosynthesis protein [Arcobacter sp. YIC-80]|uniref:lipopolysaccharide biosynthesis protein n=1 Tax=Arcobacter sp. YIC-80 TaxID=3376683 RepID=UPI00384DD2FF
MSKTSLKKNTIANYLGQFYNMFIGIAILPAYMTYLGAEAFGLIGFFTMLSAWMMLLDVGLSATISRQSASLKHSLEGMLEFKQILRSVESVFLVIALIIAIGVWSADNFISNTWLNIEVLDKNEVAYCISLMGIMIGFKWIVGLYKGAINGFEQQVWINIYGISINSLKFIGGFILVKYISQSPSSYFEYQLVIGIIELLVIHNKVYKIVPKSENFIMPSVIMLKKIMPFALGIAYTSGIWIVLTQIDKLLLSNILPLTEYGYFTLVAVIVSGMAVLSGPIGTAVQPRMTSLISTNKQDEVIRLYKKATQFVSVIGFATAGTVAVFSTELLYAWSGNMEAALWAGPVLFWYALGNGLLMVLAFQYYLQFAHGNLKYHIWGNTLFGFIQIIAMVIAVYTYSAIGVAITWFALQAIFLLVWPAYIHSKFAKGIHKEWMLKDVLPAMVSTIVVLLGFKLLNLDLLSFGRVELFALLFCIGGVVLGINALVAKDTRKMILKRFGRR